MTSGGDETILGNPCLYSQTISHIPVQIGRFIFFRLYPTTSAMAYKCVELYWSLRIALKKNPDLGLLIDQLIK